MKDTIQEIKDRTAARIASTQAAIDKATADWAAAKKATNPQGTSTAPAAGGVYGKNTAVDHPVSAPAAYPTSPEQTRIAERNEALDAALNDPTIHDLRGTPLGPYTFALALKKANETTEEDE